MTFKHTGLYTILALLQIVLRSQVAYSYYRWQKVLLFRLQHAVCQRTLRELVIGTIATPGSETRHGPWMP